MGRFKTKLEKDTKKLMGKSTFQPIGQKKGFRPKPIGKKIDLDKIKNTGKGEKVVNFKAWLRRSPDRPKWSAVEVRYVS